MLRDGWKQDEMQSITNKQMEQKYINTDWQNAKSVKQSERQKTRLENQGFNLTHVFSSGTSSGGRFSTLVFQK